MTSDRAGDFRDAVWSTAKLPPQSSLAVWSELASAQIAEMSVESVLGQAFAAIWTRYGLGPIDLNFLRTTTQRVRRSAEMAARSKSSNFELLFARRGRIRVTHGARRCVVPEQGFVALHDRYSYTLDFPEGSDCLTVRMPESWLKAWIVSRRSFTGICLGFQSAWSRPLAGLLTAISDEGLRSASLPRSVIADQIGAMCALLIEAPEEARAARKGDLESRIAERIRDRHDQHSLDPGAIADEIGISRRHLHRVLARSGKTFCGILNEQRIARAAQILKNPRHAASPIGEIAWLTGFADQSYFARVFKAKYGCTPTRFRSARSGD